MKYLAFLLILSFNIKQLICRDEDKIMKACYWPNEFYEPCFGGCAEVSCDNPRNHLRPCYPYCEPGCVCEDPYVRDDRTHQCVLPQDCSATQMGIPVPAKRSEGPPSQSSMSKYPGRLFRSHNKRDDMQLDYNENDVPNNNNNNNINNNNMMSQNNLNNNNANPINKEVQGQKENFKRGAEVSRMGNYFNIVIAPPPIKALQPRKLIQNDPYRNNPKRIN